MQKRATKLVPELREFSYKERLKKLKLPKLAYRRLRGDMIEAYKITQGRYDKEVSKFLCIQKDMVQNQHQVRGHSQTLFKRRHKLDIRKNSFSYRIVEPWNSLPEEVISAPSTKSFERRLDKFWSSQDLKYDFDTCLKILHKNSAPDPTAYRNDNYESEQEDLV